MGDDDRAIGERMRRLDELLREVERFKDPQARARTREIVQVLMEFHGAALERLMERIAADGEAGIHVIDRAASDGMVGQLLLLYGLHPVPLEKRVGRALEKVGGSVKTHGANVELLGMDDGIVRLRLHGSCHGSPSQGQTLKQTIEEAVFEMAPDVLAIEVTDELVTLPSETLPAAHFALPILAAG
ncbi:MAG TPA: NifU family protein [Phycisphaerae bacterium]